MQRQTKLDLAIEKFDKDRSTKKRKAKNNGGIPIRLGIATAKNLDELMFFMEACKRYPNASQKTRRKWLKCINLKLQFLGQQTIASL